MIVEKRVYRFDCPKCHSVWSAEPLDLTFKTFKVSFTCPVCKKESRILKTKVSIVTTRSVG